VSTYKFEGDPEQGGLPKGANVRIEDAMSRAVVHEERIRHKHGAIHLELDPGKYLYSVVRLTERAEDGTRDIEDCRYDDKFFHEIEEKAYNELKMLKPRLTRTINTSEGARWKCLVTGCGDEFTSPVGALIHEVVDHIGGDREAFLKSPRATLRLSRGGKYERLATEAAESRNARPRKSAILGNGDEADGE
jgi:hypothetical protein